MTKIEGNLINLITVQKKDSEFILKLRNDKKLNKYISYVSNSIEVQEKWIEGYLGREEKTLEYYFLVQNKDDTLCGTVRIYNIDYEKKKGEWGSFILNENRPKGAYKEVVELSLNFALKKLGLTTLNLEFNKENEKAIYIYEKCGFKKIGQDKFNHFYSINRKENI
ncbi:GNAT family N-acetyltransferase [Fusobacterium ulcerans]|uniref:GNAT family N-acetyltransferase n=1 Tax=Fusobacterium ulcerans TaxID=861 RepID=UPI002E78844D|nr:GNAT family N-acetyltransferase [Fusobacterium ulcerans]MEE0139924.1 GNAT family N-acetyltransferase [Fusobacterium ulcerans]